MSKLMQIGKSIKRLRKRAGLTQTELAQMVGLSRVAISNIELGNSRTKSERLFDFAGALGVSIDELTGYGGETPNVYLKSLATAGDRIAELEQIVENLRRELGARDRVLRVLGAVVDRWREEHE